LPGEPKRLEHPPIVYVIGFIFKIITLAVIIGVIYQLTFAHHGPGFLIPIKERIEEKDRSAIMDDIKRNEEFEVHRHFHNVVPFPELSENMRPVCYICHSDYPHSKNKKVRALLNMHTQFFVCETCHIEERVGATIIYKWYNPLNEEPKGPFFGTSYNPETGNLVPVDDKLSKIATYFKKGDKLESAILKQDAPYALDYMKVRDKLSPEQRDNVKKKFHENIKPKGHECKACHAKNGLLNFRKLGFAENRIVDLEQLNIAGMITKYEKFYIPNLFKD
jgi:hypothetical protein